MNSSGNIWCQPIAVFAFSKVGIAAIVHIVSVNVWACICIYIIAACIDDDAWLRRRRSRIWMCSLIHPHYCLHMHQIHHLLYFIIVTWWLRCLNCNDRWNDCIYVGVGIGVGLNPRIYFGGGFGVWFGVWISGGVWGSIWRWGWGRNWRLGWGWGLAVNLKSKVAA